MRPPYALMQVFGKGMEIRFKTNWRDLVTDGGGEGSCGVCVSVWEFGEECPSVDPMGGLESKESKDAHIGVRVKGLLIADVVSLLFDIGVSEKVSKHSSLNDRFLMQV